MYIVSCYFHTPVSAQSKEEHVTLVSVSGGLLSWLQMTCDNNDDFMLTFVLLLIIKQY
jgi:hypothetical protein